MSWRLAQSLVTLRNQINEAYPNRSKVSDGTIGDAAHRKVPSDHNPNSKGVVCALDITHDPKSGLDAHELAETLIKNPHPNLKYVISDYRIAGPFTGWNWGYYDGINPHTQHIHISVGNNSDGKSTGNYDSTEKWNIGKGANVTSEQILTSRPVFRADYYLQVNKDVARHKNTQAYALEHWLKHGIKEGRPSAPNFHVKEYMANYSDLRKAFGDKGYAKAVKHYFEYGINEGRAGRKKTTVQVVDRTSELKNKIIDFVKGLK